MIYIIIAFLAGAMVILSMIINSRLSKEIGIFQGVFVNYIVGLTCAILLFIACNSQGLFKIKNVFQAPLWAYFGGALGVIIVSISNIIIPKIPTIYSTLLIFMGQLFCGVMIDYFKVGVISKGKLIGGFIILIGMLYNFYIDKNKDLEHISEIN